jgi:hypothetical protein
MPAYTANASNVYYNKSNLQYVLLHIAIELYLSQCAIRICVLHYRETPLGKCCDTWANVLLLTSIFILVVRIPKYKVTSYTKPIIMCISDKTYSIHLVQ